jgi:hypothetical protein
MAYGHAERNLALLRRLEAERVRFLWSEDQGFLRPLLRRLTLWHHLTRLRRLTQRHRCRNDAHPTTSLPQRRGYRHPPARATGSLPAEEPHPSRTRQLLESLDQPDPERSAGPQEAN